MNNVNILNRVDINQKKSKSLSKFPYVLALCTILNIANPTEMKASSNGNRLPDIEVVSDSDIIANIERRTGTKLPDLYNEKLKNFINTNKIMNDEGSAKFTADFVVKQMQSDWGISKQSQLLFIRTHVYNEITGTYLYDGSDGDENRLNEYSNVVDSAEKCGKDFRTGYIEYTKKISAEAKQQSAEYDRRSAEADKQSAEAKQQSAEYDRRSAEADKQSAEATYKGLNELVRFYNLYKKNPNNIKPEELKQAKGHSERIIENCKKYGINYKTKLSKEMLKFYGVE